MKTLNLKEITRQSLLALILAFSLSFTIFAQNNANNTRTEERGAERAQTTRVVEEDDTDWGWIGLLGLLGLAGLIPKKRSIEVKGVRDANENRPAS